MAAARKQLLRRIMTHLPPKRLPKGTTRVNPFRGTIFRTLGARALRITRRRRR